MSDTDPSEHPPSFYVERQAAKRSADPLLSLIVPVFNEAEGLPAFIEATRDVLTTLNVRHEYIFVDDGSRDESARLIAIDILPKHPGVLIGFSRNFGKEAAVTAGLDEARGDIAIVIDADLQDPPDLIGDMVAGWRQGYDVVYGLRTDRSSDSFTKRKTANLFYKLFRRLSRLDMSPNAGDFRLIDRQVIEALKQLPERNRFMKGLFAWVGFSSLAIPYKRPPRQAGTSSWTYWRLWNFALDGFTGFSTVPLRIWSYFGTFVAFASMIFAGFLIVQVLLYGIEVPGYASLMVGLLFFSGIQLISIGLIGEYIGRSFTELKHRPLYLLRDKIEARSHNPVAPQDTDQTD